MVPEQELIIKLLTVLFPEAKIYLFGSRARGDHTEISDIDIAIDADKPIERLELIRAKNVIQALNIPQTVDIVDFNSVPPDMQNIISREKIIWKS